MNLLVTVQQAADHLRRPDTAGDDSDLQLKVLAASAAVLNYLEDAATFLDSSGDVMVDSNGEPVDVPFEVQAATLLMVGELYVYRTAESPSVSQTGSLPAAVIALLYPLRVPTAL